MRLFRSPVCFPPNDKHHEQNYFKTHFFECPRCFLKLIQIRTRKDKKKKHFRRKEFKKFVNCLCYELSRLNLSLYNLVSSLEVFFYLTLVGHSTTGQAGKKVLTLGTNCFLHWIGKKTFFLLILLRMIVGFRNENVSGLYNCGYQCLPAFILLRFHAGKLFFSIKFIGALWSLCDTSRSITVVQNCTLLERKLGMMKIFSRGAKMCKAWVFMFNVIYGRLNEPRKFFFTNFNDQWSWGKIFDERFEFL